MWRRIVGWLALHCPGCGETLWHRAAQTDRTQAYVGNDRKPYLFFRVTCSKCGESWEPKPAKVAQLKRQIVRPRANPYLVAH